MYKPIKRCSTRVIVKAISCFYVYLANSSYFLNILEKSKTHEYINNVINKRSWKQTVLYALFLIQNSVVSNSKEQIAENHRFMYQIICNCDLMIELKEMDLNV